MVSKRGPINFNASIKPVWCKFSEGVPTETEFEQCPAIGSAGACRTEGSHRIPGRELPKRGTRTDRADDLPDVIQTGGKRPASQNAGLPGATQATSR